jgi:hypothetical protein
MDNFPRIAVVNTGWSDDYFGGQVVGKFSYLETGVGHERYNFMPNAAGRYFGYAPPLGENDSPPKPAHLEDWLVFFVSKRPGRPGLYLVGWYEGAKFEGSYTTRPDADDLGVDSEGGKFSYTVSSDKAYMVPLPLRTMKFKGGHVRSYAYLRGNGDTDKWRQILARTLIFFRKEIMKGIDEDNIDSSVAVEGGWSQDAARRKLIEKKAVEAVIKYYSDWKYESKEEQKIGYDLLFWKPKTGQELHVEVKGTSLEKQCFFISKKEYEYGRELSKNDRRPSRNTRRPLWRLAVVQDALSEKSVINVHTFSKMEALFEIAPIQWYGIIKTGS